jgi:hypothetical protein
LAPLPPQISTSAAPTIPLYLPAPASSPAPVRQTLSHRRPQTRTSPHPTLSSCARLLKHARLLLRRSPLRSRRLHHRLAHRTKVRRSRGR